MTDTLKLVHGNRGGNDSIECPDPMTGAITGEERDWGNADWPSDAEIAAAAGVPAVRFVDGCDGRLDEGLYSIED